MYSTKKGGPHLFNMYIIRLQILKAVAFILFSVSDYKHTTHIKYVSYYILHQSQPPDKY